LIRAGRDSGGAGNGCSDHVGQALLLEAAATVLACAVGFRYSTGSINQVDGGRHL
jgi:hypothetical protein